ncbi:MAG TPA: ribbon-helix-helix protein, CopG family [Caulobacteraceae bacterium]|jgi:predicted transcriptional regulator
MADGGLSVQIDDDLADEVRAAAAASGVPVEVFVRDAVAHRLSAAIDWSDDPDPRIDERIIDEALSRGDTIPWDEIRPWVESWGKPGELPPPRWRK